LAKAFAHKFILHPTSLILACLQKIPWLALQWTVVSAVNSAYFIAEDYASLVPCCLSSVLDVANGAKKTIAFRQPKVI
jgi:hypothetical protein